ncbi:MAG: type II 3-dehydroquinate dehydratase [Bacteroidales bacterium]
MNFLIINGPNLNLLGKREPGVYGSKSFPEFLDELRIEFSGHTIDYFQSNHEGELLDRIHDAEGKYAGIILNAGAYTHTSIALADAISAINVPVVEVHISNIFKREKFRHVSKIAAVCGGSISGFGLNSYILGILSFLKPDAKTMA